MSGSQQSRLGCVLVLRFAAAGLGKLAHSFQRTGVPLRRSFLELAARGSVILWTTDAVGHHQTELKLGFGIGLGSLREQRARARGICGRARGRRDRGEIRNPARIGSFLK